MQRLLLKLIYSAGLRRSELIKIKIKHLDYKNHHIKGVDQDNIYFSWLNYKNSKGEGYNAFIVL